MKKYVLILASIILISCGQSSKIQPIEPTLEPSFSVESLNAYNTMIVPSTVPTLTFTPTMTNTSTPTFTLTPTLEPFFQTEIAITQTQNALIEAKTATIQEKKIRMTGTAEVRSQQRTSTQIFKINKIATEVAYRTMIAQYKPVNARKLATYPDEYKGDFVRFDIKIFNFIDDTSLQGWIIGGNYDPIIVTFRTPYRDIYEDEIITIFGIVQGKQTGTNSFGAGLNQAWVSDAWFRK